MRKLERKFLGVHGQRLPSEGAEVEYKESGFDHEEFWQWVRDKSNKHSVYISEYNASADFKKILEFSRNSTLPGGTNKNQPNECLFTIRK